MFFFFYLKDLQVIAGKVLITRVSMYYFEKRDHHGQEFRGFYDYRAIPCRYLP